MNLSLLKSTVLAAALCWVGGEAYAATTTVVKYSFDSDSDPTLTLDNLNGNRGTANYDYNLNGDTFLNVWGENNSNGSKVVTLTSDNLVADDIEWTLEFDWAGYSGCNGNAGYTQIRDIDGKTILSFDDAAGWGKTFTISAGGTLSCYPCNRDSRISAKTGSVLTAGYWHHVKVVGNATGVKLYVQDYAADGTLNSAYAIDGATVSASNASPASIALRPGSCGSVAINDLVLSKETKEISTVDYTVKFVCGDKEVKASETRKVVSGEAVAINAADKEAFLSTDNIKYYYVSDDAATITPNADGSSVVTVTYRQANDYKYTVQNNFGTTLASGTIVEGESVQIPFPKYINDNGTLYTRAANGSEYRETITPDADNYTKTLDYKNSGTTNVVYYSEGEDIAGAIKTTAGGNMKTRSSNAACGYSSSDITLLTLTPGKYSVTTCIYANSSAGYTATFAYGDKTFTNSSSKATNSQTATASIEVTEATPLIWKGKDDNKNGLDYIFIEKTADIISLNDSYVHSTYCPEFDLDFTDVTDVEVYKVKVDADKAKAISTKVEGKIQAGEGILLKRTGDATSVTVPTTTGAEKLTDNDLVGATEDITSGWDSMNAYMLVSDTQFQKIGTGTLAKGKAYLLVSDNVATKNQSIYFGDEVNSDDPVTAINGVADNADAQNGAIYTLQGVKVEKAEKGGIYIINGKKYIK